MEKRIVKSNANNMRERYVHIDKNGFKASKKQNKTTCLHFFERGGMSTIFFIFLNEILQPLGHLPRNAFQNGNLGIGFLFRRWEQSCVLYGFACLFCSLVRHRFL